MRTVKKRSPVEAQLDALQAIAETPSSAEAHDQIRAALRNAPSLVAARAARIVREHAMDGFAEDLDATFQRFLLDPVKSDPGCHAKLAVIEALDYAEHSDPQPFLLATRHIQLEPAWGRPVDSAVALRARGILSLARLEYPDLPIIAGDLLADSQSPVRQATADALAAGQQRSFAGLLLLRWNFGDDDPLVIMACMTGVLTLAPDQALVQLRNVLLGTDQNAREAAIVVLAQSSRNDALDLLLEHIANTRQTSDRANALRALGLHRSERALDIALKMIVTGEIADAEATIAGLAARRFESGVRELVEAAARQNGDARLEATIRTAFASADR